MGQFRRRLGMSPELYDPAKAVSTGNRRADVLLEPAGKPKTLATAPFVEPINIPNIVQPDNFSCGACCVQSVTEFFHVGPKSLAAIKKALHTTEADSTEPERIVAYLQSLGLSVEARQHMSIDDLRECWRQGKPVICPIREYESRMSSKEEEDYGHYVVAIGEVPGPEPMIIVQDPSYDNVLDGQNAVAAGGRMLIDQAKWLEVWHDHESHGKPFVRYGIAVGKPA